MKTQRRMEIVEVTPDLANQWLDKNTKNRPLRKGLVETYAAAMRAGRWQLTPEPVIFSAPFREKGSLEHKPETLMDGQHRLMAVVTSGVTVPMTVWFGCEPDEFNALGQGRMRTNGDIIAINNVTLKDPLVIASAVSVFIRYVLSYNKPVQPWMVQEMLNINTPLFEAASRYKAKLRKLIIGPSMGAVLLGRTVAAQKTDDLVDQLKSQIGFTERDPARVLARYLYAQQIEKSEARDGHEMTLYKCTFCIARKLQGRSLENLPESAEGLYWLRSEASKTLTPLLRIVYGNATPKGFFAPEPGRKVPRGK